MSVSIRYCIPPAMPGLPGVMILLLIMLFSPPAPAKVSHPADMACRECHLAQLPITQENAHQLTDSQEVLCARCHENAIRVSHPSGFPAMRMIPAEYPVDWKGDITCSTCHTVHGTEAGLMRGGKKGRELCLSCHDQGFFVRMADEGTSIRQKGHLARTADLQVGLIDAYSINCMSCHNNNGLGPAGTKYEGVVLAHSETTMKHPIGFLYVNTAGRDRYHDIGRLDARLVLPDGRLSCVTCHLAYSDSHGELAVANTGSALCYQCHDI